MSPADSESSAFDRLGPVIDALNAPARPERLPARVLGAVRQVVGARVAMLYVVDAHRRRLVLEAVRGRRAGDVLGAAQHLHERRA